MKLNIRKIFGYFDFFNLEKLKKTNPDIADDWKIRTIYRWVAPSWLMNRIETIEFENIYKKSGSPRRTTLVFCGAKNIYWIFFRRQTDGDLDWKWRPRFDKTTNDHTCCG